jgi:hypothetical protein
VSKWQSKKTTIPPQETQQELPLQPSNENTAVVTEAQLIQQIGQLLRQTNYFAQLSLSHQPDVQSNLVIPVTAEALSFALWAMGNHLMSLCDQLRTSASTSNRSSWIMLNDELFDETVDAIQDEIEDFIAFTIV